MLNDKILTMDSKNSVASSVAVKDGRIVSVGRRSRSLGPCTQVINLKGRTVIPGLIDSHIHFLRHGQRPGHDMRTIETAFSIAELKTAIAERAAAVPLGEFITAVGGWHPAQFAENRFPTLAELDAAAPNHPVYLQVGFNGPSVTNTLGKDFFESKGVDVDDATGALPAGPAFAALRALQTFEDQKRGTRELMQFANSVGLTGVIDPGGLPFPGAGFFDSIGGYDPLLALWRERDVYVRVRIFFISRDGDDLSALRARIDNAFMGFGDDWVKIAGLGEEVVLRSGDTMPPRYSDAVNLIAQNGWNHTQHSSTPNENQAQLAAFEGANASVPIAPLHWSLAHVFEISQANLNRLIAIGAGVTVQNQRYLSGSGPNAGPPFRRIVDSGINAGGGTDASNVAPVNPWLSICYMVTGKNSSGQVINGSQTITRLEALRLYTIGSAWFSQDERDLGSIEVGKLADLVVLSDEYLSVPEESIRKIRSILTIVGGEIVSADSSIVNLD